MRAAFAFAILAFCCSIHHVADAGGNRQLLVGGWKAESVYHNGVIYTVDKESSTHQAVAIRKGKIMWVGAEDTYMKYVGKNTTVVDLQGKMMLPGFLDGHTHMFPLFPQIPGDTPDQTFDYMKAFLQSPAANNGTDAWYPFFGFKKDVFFSQWGRYPNAADMDAHLDPIFAALGVPTPPVLAMEQYCHACFMSSKYLAEMSKYINFTGENMVPGALIEWNYTTNKPTGFMTDSACALAFGQPWFPGHSLEHYKSDLTAIFGAFSSWGITTIFDAWSNIGKLTMNLYPAVEELRLEAEAKGQPLPVRFRGSYRPNPFAQTDDEIVGNITALTTKYTSDACQFHAIKIFADGDVSGHTTVNSPRSSYVDVVPPLVFTNLTTPITEVTRLTVLGNKNGWPVHIHSTGDGATSAMLDALEAAAAQSAPGVVRKARNTIAHNWNVHPEDFQRFNATGTIATTFTAFAFSPGSFDFNTDAILFGETVAKQCVPIKGFLDNGVLISTHSDFPLNSAKITYPVFGLQVAQTRKSIEISSLADLDQPSVHFNAASFPPRDIDQAMSFDQAVRSYTINTAYALGLDKKIGSIEVGKIADLVVLDQNLNEIPKDKYARGTYRGLYLAPPVPYTPMVNVELTIREGFVVYNKTAAGPCSGHSCGGTHTKEMLDWLEKAAGEVINEIEDELDTMLAASFY